MSTKINMPELWSKAKVFLHKITYYSVVIVSLGVGFALGFYYNLITDIKVDKKPKVVNKSEINIAVDENSNLLLINKSNGTYIMYQDSVGFTVFNLYARNMFGQHDPAVKSDQKSNTK